MCFFQTRVCVATQTAKVWRFRNVMVITFSNLYKTIAAFTNMESSKKKKLSFSR